MENWLDKDTRGKMRLGEDLPVSWEPVVMGIMNKNKEF